MRFRGYSPSPPRYIVQGGHLLFVSVVYPLADIRRFISTAIKPLDKPYWPIPEKGQFTRNFGEVKTRKGFKDWIPEPYSCEAKRAVRIPNNFHLYIHPKKLKSPVKVCFDVISRRYFFDGSAMGKLEINLKLCKAHIQYEKSISVKQLLKNLAEFKVKITNYEKGQGELFTCKLRQLEKHLPHIVLNSTIPINSQNDYQPQWIYSCPPSIIVNCAQHFPPKKSRSAIQRTCAFYKGNARRIIHFTYQKNMSNWDCSTWVISAPKDTSAIRRKFRITLGRLNCESAVLTKVLKLLLNHGPMIETRSDCSDRLQGYLFKTTTSILGLTEFDHKLYKVKQRDNPVYYDFFPEANKIHTELTTSERYLILDLLKSTLSIKGNYLKKLRHYLFQNEDTKVTNNYVFNAPVNQAGEITNEAEVNQNIFLSKDESEKLKLEIEKLIPILQERASGVTKDELESLTSLQKSTSEMDSDRYKSKLSSLRQETIDIIKKVGVPVLVKLITQQIN